MADLNTFTTWLIGNLNSIGQVIFTRWGIVGIAIFCFPIIRRLIKIFKNTF